MDIQIPQFFGHSDHFCIFLHFHQSLFTSSDTNSSARHSVPSARFRPPGFASAPPAPFLPEFGQFTLLFLAIFPFGPSADLLTGGPFLGDLLSDQHQFRLRFLRLLLRKAQLPLGLNLSLYAVIVFNLV